VIARARHFLSLPAADHRAYFWTACWLLSIRMMFKLMSFDQISMFVSRRTVRRSSAQAPSLARLAAIIRNVGEHMPSTCLSRSLAGALVLARFGHKSELRIGVSTAQDFHAHAWLECEGIAITEPDLALNELTTLTIGS